MLHSPALTNVLCEGQSRDITVPHPCGHHKTGNIETQNRHQFLSPGAVRDALGRQLEPCPEHKRSALALSHFVDGSGSLPVLLSLQQVHEPLFARADTCSLPWPACAGPSSLQEQLCGLTVPVSSTGKLLGFLACPSAD